MAATDPPEYFPNRDAECMGASLANLLLIRGEEALAEKVYEEFRHHEVVHPSGLVAVSLTPLIIRDLTEQAYDGRVHTARRDYTLDESLKACYGRMTDEIIHKIEAERLSGNLVEYDDAFEVYSDLPALMHLNAESQLNGHTVVKKGDSTFVSDGKEMDTLLEGFYPTALIEVFPLQP